MHLETINNQVDAEYIYGAEAIARELNLDKRQVHYMREKGGFPIGKMPNGKLFISRSKAHAFMAKLLDEGVVTHD